MPDGNSSKNSWKSVERENRENKGIGEKMKGQRFPPRSAYFDDKRGKQTESQSVTSVQPEKGAVRTEKQGHPDY